MAIHKSVAQAVATTSLFFSFALNAQPADTLEDVLSRLPNVASGFQPKPLPEKPWRYQTAEGMEIQLEVIVQELSHPWGLAFLPDGNLLVTERNDGRLRIIENGQLNPTPIAGVPEVRSFSYSGLHAVVLHPNFENNKYIYLTYMKPLGEEDVTLAVYRGTWNSDKNSIENGEDIFEAGPGVATVSNLMFDKDGFIRMSVHSTGDEGQDLSKLNGKTLRITESGKPAPGNPFTDNPKIRSEIYTYGHRTTQAFIQHPETGDVWSLEMGPNGGDKVNILKSGANYGWPEVSLGRDYAGPWQGPFEREDVERPIIYWMPSISTAGMLFYTGDKLPKWNGDLLVTGLRTGEISGTGVLQRVRFNGLGEEIRRESLLTDLHYRIRSVFQDEDGYVYILTDEENGAILKISEAK